MKESKRIFIGVFSLILLLTGCVSTPTWKYTSIYHYEEYFSESNKYRASRDRYYIFEDEITINELIVKDLKRYQFIGFLLPVDQQEKVELTFSDRITSYNVCYTKLLRSTHCPITQCPDERQIARPGGLKRRPFKIFGY